MQIRSAACNPLSASTALIALCLGLVSDAAIALDQHRFKTVKSGRQVSLGGHMRFNKDCVGNVLPKAYLVEPPEHGSICLQVRMIKVQKTYRDLPRYPHCIGKPVRGIRVIYSSDGGYEGEDRLAYKIEYSDFQLNRKVDLDVKWEDTPFLDKPGSEKLKNGPQEPGPVPLCAALLS